MKYLAVLVDELRKNVSEGLKITREDSSSRLVELLEEASSRQIEFKGSELTRVIELEHVKPIDIHRLHALDTSSRAIETPYIFMGIGTGSVLNRFTGMSIDIPDTTAILGLREPLCRHIAVIPEIEVNPGLINTLVDIPGLILSNPLGTRYTSDYNKYFVLLELRLSIENCLLREFSEIIDDETILLIDGPLIYPQVTFLDTHIPPREKIAIYIDSLRTLNAERSRLIENIMGKRGVVLGIVKRLSKSYYLSSLNPLNLSIGRVNDETYISIMMMKNKTPLTKPMIIGPVKVRQEDTGSRLMWYITTPRRLYPFSSDVGNYTVYRVEVFEEIDLGELDLLNYIFYDSLKTGSLLPLSILIADRRVKKISSSLTAYTLYLTGLSRESTGQYISIL